MSCDINETMIVGTCNVIKDNSGIYVTSIDSIINIDLDIDILKPASKDSDWSLILNKARVVRVYIDANTNDMTQWLRDKKISKIIDVYES